MQAWCRPQFSFYTCSKHCPSLIRFLHTTTLLHLHQQIPTNPLADGNHLYFPSYETRIGQSFYLASVIVSTPDVVPSSIAPIIDVYATALSPAKFSGLLQKLNIEGHAAMYRAIMNHGPERVAAATSSDSLLFALPTHVSHYQYFPSPESVSTNLFCANQPRTSLWDALWIVHQMRFRMQGIDCSRAGSLLVSTSRCSRNACAWHRNWSLNSLRVNLSYCCDSIQYQRGSGASGLVFLNIAWQRNWKACLRVP